jgi:RNA polymerase sigma factor (sigma-70 family)
MSSEDLAGGGMKGDMDFAAAFENYRQQVHRWLYAVVGPGTDLEELTECVFFRAYVRRDRFEPAKGSFGTWLHKLTHNVALSSVRRRKRPPDSLDAMTEDEAPTCAGPEEVYEVKAQRERLYERIDALPPRERHAFLGRTLRDQPWQELADEMRCCLRTAHNLYARAVTTLRREL